MGIADNKIAEAYVDIRANLSPLVSGIAKAKGILAASLKSVSSIAGGLLNFKSLLLAGGIGGALAYATKQALEQEKADIRLAAALQSVGQYTQENFIRLKNLSSHLQKITVHSDDALQSIMQFGLSGGLTAEQIEYATKAAIGLSAVFSKDLRISMKAVLAAMQGDFNLLQRFVPIISKAKNETQKFAIFQKLAAESFYVAVQSAQSASGVLARIKNVFDDITEVVGFAVLPYLQRFGNWFLSNSGTVQNWANSIAKHVSGALALIQDSLNLISGGQIDKAVENLINELSKAIQKFSPVFTNIGINIGLPVAAGILKGIAMGIGRIFTDFGKSFYDTTIALREVRLAEENFALQKLHYGGKIKEVSQKQRDLWRQGAKRVGEVN